MNAIRTWETVGQVGVDSGTIQIGDPCYHVGKTPETAYPEMPKTWNEYCKVTGDDNIHQFGRGTAVMIGGFGGDGTFPVQVRRDRNGLITAARIIFDGSLDEEDDDG